MSDMLAETTLFALDFAVNQKTDGARLYRLHDDIWFWGQEKACIKGWEVMNDFAKLMGLEFNEEKTGSIRITRKPNKKAALLSDKLPKGDVKWGFLKLDAESGRFLINQDEVDKHIEELRRQLEACKSTFDWIQAWNVYGARFFTNNFGRPANCYGLVHVDDMLSTFSRIQSKLFANSGGSVTSTLKQMITDRFGVKDIPEGYLYFPSSMGGLDLKSPFVGLYLIREKIAKDEDKVPKNPDTYMDKFFENEEIAYNKAKIAYEARLDKNHLNHINYRHDGFHNIDSKLRDEPFMSMEEFTRYRERTSAGKRLPNNFPFQLQILTL
jgi:hypothetical protein